MIERIDRYKNGTTKAEDPIKDGELDGYREWSRLDGSKMRSGHFKSGKQVGEWMTFQPQGREAHEDGIISMRVH